MKHYSYADIFLFISYNIGNGKYGNSENVIERQPQMIQREQNGHNNGNK